MKTEPTPSLREFSEASLVEVRPHAPKTLIYAVSGARSAAELADVPISGDDFVNWIWWELHRCVELFFTHGIKHLFVPLKDPTQFLATTTHKDIWDQVEERIAGSVAIEHYRSSGWRVRMACSQYIPQLKDIGEKLIAETTADDAHTLWFYVVPDLGSPWEWLLEAANNSGANTYHEALLALYGEDFPPASVFLSTAKPLVSNLQLPPLLVKDAVQCYWSLRPGYSLDEKQLRMILYDYAFLRKTWQQDKTGRAEQAIAHRQMWERGEILGAGKRLEPFYHSKRFL